MGRAGAVSAARRGQSPVTQDSAAAVGGRAPEEALGVAMSAALGGLSLEDGGIMGCTSTVVEKRTFLDVKEFDDNSTQPSALRSQTTSDLSKYSRGDAVAEYVDDGTGWRKTSSEDTDILRSRDRLPTLVSEPCETDADPSCLGEEPGAAVGSHAAEEDLPAAVGSPAAEGEPAAAIGGLSPEDGMKAARRAASFEDGGIMGSTSTVVEKRTFLDVEEFDDDSSQPSALRSQTTSDLSKYSRGDVVAEYVDDGTGWRKTTSEDLPDVHRRPRLLTHVSEAPSGDASAGDDDAAEDRASADAGGGGPGAAEEGEEEEEAEEEAEAERKPVARKSLRRSWTSTSEDGVSMGWPASVVLDDAGTAAAAAGSPDDWRLGADDCARFVSLESLEDGVSAELDGEEERGAGDKPEGRRRGANQQAKRTEKRRLKRQAESTAAQREVGRPTLVDALPPPMPVQGHCYTDAKALMASWASMQPALMVAAMQANNMAVYAMMPPMPPAVCVPPVWASGFGHWPTAPRSPPPEPSAPEAAGGQTTVMLRNLPNNYTRTMLLELLDQEGFRGRYDFVYIPHDFKTSAGLGFAFVNLLTPADAERMRRQLEGFRRWAIPSAKVCSVGWSGPDQQGLAANIKRYRNSSVMHESVSEDCRPLLFVAGAPAQFPRNTRKLWPPDAAYGARANRA